MDLHFLFASETFPTKIAVVEWSGVVASLVDHQIIRLRERSVAPAAIVGFCYGFDLKTDCFMYVMKFTLQIFFDLP